MTAPTRQSRARRAARFTQADIARAIKGAAAAGVLVQQVTIDQDGRISVVLAGTQSVAPSDATAEGETGIPDRWKVSGKAA
jgi:hypothetical protein